MKNRKTKMIEYEEKYGNIPKDYIGYMILLELMIKNQKK